jgi:2,4-dienoyl-CoA reductase-like NADH-dependent reductase (Old Yellow Enzyme family)
LHIVHLSFHEHNESATRTGPSEIGSQYLINAQTVEVIAFGISLYFFENRARILREIAAAVRGSWPERAPLFVRVSATAWVDGGCDIQQAVELARQLKELGADLIYCSSGGNVVHAKIPVGAAVPRRAPPYFRKRVIEVKVESDMYLFYPH